VVTVDLEPLGLHFGLDLRDPPGDLLFQLRKLLDEPILHSARLLERSFHPRGIAFRRTAALSLSAELHLTFESIAERHTPHGVVLIARVTQTHLRAADLDLSSEVDDVLLLFLQQLFVGIELGSEALDSAWIPRDAAGSVFFQHAAQAVD